MDRKKKAVVFTAFLLILAIASILIPLSSVKPRPPLGKWIDVGIYCAETEEPVPNGLAVRLVGEGYNIIGFTKDGHVLFGSGLVDGTYVVSWYWNAPYEYEVTIDCSLITWYFDYYVPNPTITKHFYYETPYNGFPPIVGLKVTLVEDGVPIASQVTDTTGTVFFGGDLVEVCKEYYLTWTYGGVDDSEGPIHFAYDEFGQLPVCAWEGTNYLEPKSGGGK